jgi:hypothetical protein
MGVRYLNVADASSPIALVAAAGYVGRMRPRRGWRARSALALVTAAAALLFAAPAFATDCAGLQAALNAAVAGDTVTLDEGSVCAGPFTLPARAITLTGGGSGATIDGGGLTRALTGTNIGSTTISNLTFQNGVSDASGGAISIGGNSSPTLDRLRFLHNHAATGGAVSIGSSATTGSITISNSLFGDGTDAGRNSASADAGALFVFSNGVPVAISNTGFLHNLAAVTGGGMRVTMIGGSPGLTLTDSAFDDNALAGAGRQGGGALITTGGANQSITISRTRFTGNRILPGAAVTDPGGAGVRISNAGTAQTPVTLTDTLFDANSVGKSPKAGVILRGGGLWLSGANLTSLNDEFTNNSFIASSSTPTSRGVGILYDTCIGGEGSATITNGAIAGNEVVGAAEGAGFHMECANGSAQLEVRDTTISGNTALADTAGLWGSATTTLVVTNSILAGNTNSDVLDLNGFAGRTISYSDVCYKSTGHPGIGNICKPPYLSSAVNGNVHETTRSPTVDIGSNSLVPFGLATDYEGDGRILDGTFDGKAVVDMGADEFGVPELPPPPAPTFNPGDAGPGSSPPPVTPATKPPAQLVLPERITPGSARLVGPTGCVAKAFRARVRGTKIAKVIFYLDGKKLKAITKPDKKGEYKLSMKRSGLKTGVHRVIAKVSFQSGSGTKAKTFRLSFQRCAKRLVAPRFTG